MLIWLRCMLGVILVGLSLSASAQLGANFRVESYLPRPGAVTYSWDRTSETIDTTYTIRRGGVVVRESSPRTAVNGNDGLLTFGEDYQVTLQVNDGPESAPITVSMPAPPVAVAGGEILYVILSFPDRQHPVFADTETRVRSDCAWVTSTSGGRTVWTPTFVQYMALKPFAAYSFDPVYFPDLLDIEKVKAELVVAFDLKNRQGLHRVAIDVEGLGHDTTLNPYNSGSPMWPGSDIYGSPIDRNNFVHELLHTYGLWHYGFIGTLPSDIDDLTQVSPGYWSAEIMGNGIMTGHLSALNLWMLGWRDPAQLVRPTASTTLTLTNNLLTTGVQAAILRVTDGGAAYVVDYMEPYVMVTLRPTVNNSQTSGISLFAVGFGQTGRIFTDGARGIAVDVLSLNASTATLAITMPGVAPPPPPPQPPPVVTTVAISAPFDGAIVKAKVSVALSATSSPAAPITWTASGGSISGNTWKAPAARGKSYRLTATAAGNSASVTVRVQ